MVPPTYAKFLLLDKNVEVIDRPCVVFSPCPG